jgi:hypothetical protein
MAYEHKVCDDTIMDDDIPTMDEFMNHHDISDGGVVVPISGAGNPDVVLPRDDREPASSSDICAESELPSISSIRLTLGDKTKTGDPIPYKWFSHGIAKQSLFVKMIVISII